MIVSVGVDIVDLRKIAAAINRWGSDFVRRICTPEEIAECDRLAQPTGGYSAVFVAKEALFKAIGTGWTCDVQWEQAQLRHVNSKRPLLATSGPLSARLADMDVTRTWVSLGRAGCLVQACVVLERSSRRENP